MRSFALAAGALPLALLPAAALLAQSPVPGPSFEQVIDLRTAGSPAVSPDGRSVLFTLRETEWDRNRFDTEIWRVAPGEAPVRLTRTEEGSSTAPAWSPDGRWIAFAADRGERRQIHLLPAGGGEARPLTDAPEGVSGFAWSPDGRRIAWVAGESDGEADRSRSERFGAFRIEDAELRPSHLWVVDVPADFGADPLAPACPAPVDAAAAAEAERCPGLPRPRRLTEGAEYTVTGFAWSPDGTRIAFGHQRDAGINSWPSADLSVVEVESGRVRPLVTDPGSDGGPVWSPDGAWILYATEAGDTLTNYFRNGQLRKIPAGGGASVRLAADLDEELGGLTWTRAGILGLARRGTLRHVYRIDPDGEPTRPLGEAPEHVLAYDVAADGSSLAMVAQTPTTLPEVYLGPVSGGPPAALTSLTRQLEGWTLGSAEVVSWTSRDGARIEGVLHRPPGFDPARKYPLFVVIHGGPTGIDVPQPVTGYVYPVMQWLARGALVLRPNYRGSAGYGEAFRSLNVRNLGVGDAWDVLSGVDHLVSQGIVDTTRMGAMGWSQGGYISAFLTTTTDRFRAISVGAGISDWMTYYVNTDIHPFTRQYLGATPWADPEIYARTSPISYIDDARTPTLIQHGELDRRVPIANAFELYQGLRDRGVPTELVVYTGFGHGIDRPREQLAAMWHNWEWFGERVWGEPVDAPPGAGELVPPGVRQD